MANKHYPIIVRFTKVFIKGMLKNIEKAESMGFTSVKQADNWVSRINNAKTLDYKLKDVQFDLNRDLK